MASLKAKQDDLRRLMKERRGNLSDSKNKVDSPFAKYNDLGQLFCIVCNIQIKNNGLWASHIAGKLHKENALKKKKGNASATPNVASWIGEKKPEIQSPPKKKLKVEIDGSSSSKLEIVKSQEKLSLLNSYSSSSEDESDLPHIESNSNTMPDNVLPKDFFDAAPTSLPINQEQHTEEKPVDVAINSVKALPEGFFDDPVLDAKARNIEYKDPVEEEWERYQRAIAEETNVSKTIIEEDLEEVVKERDLAELTVEISLWEKSKNFQIEKEEATSKILSNKGKENVLDSTDDELEEDDLLDWRSKGVKKKR